MIRACGSLPGLQPFSWEENQTLFWVMPSVGGVYFQQILSEVITRLYTLAKRKMNPRAGLGYSSCETLFTREESCNVLSTDWRKGHDLILGSKGGGLEGVGLGK